MKAMQKFMVSGIVWFNRNPSKAFTKEAIFAVFPSIDNRKKKKNPQAF
jgi:hypothetical protein